MKNICIISYIIVFVCSCSNSKKNNTLNADNIIIFNENPNTYIPEFVDSVSFLKLENVEKAFLSHLSKVIIKNNQIYIGDFVFHKIVVYNMDGTFKFSIDKKGRSPQEYLEIKSFTVDDSVIYLIDNHNRKLKKYNVENGDYIGEKKMPIIAWDLEILSNGIFVFAYSPLKGGKLYKSQSHYRLFFTDKDLNVIKKMFPYSNKEVDPIAKNSFFSTTHDEVIYNWCGSDSFILINKNDIDSIKINKINFGNKELPQSYRQNFDLMNDGRYNYLYSTPIINGNYLALEVSTGDYFECFLYNMHAKQIAKNPIDNMFNTMSFPCCCDNKGRFVYIIENKEYYDNLVAEGFNKADKDIERHLQDGIAILFYTMKK